jgi:hypothetical protein
MGDLMPDAQVNGFCGLNFIAFICSSFLATSDAKFIKNG